MGNQNYIEINGKKFDAVTGKMIGNATNISNNQTAKPSKNTGVVDGFMKAPRKSSSPHHIAQHSKKAPQKSKTLMRTVVNKPTQPTKKNNNQQSTIKKNKLGYSHRRARLAQEVKKSPNIQKYDQQKSRTSVVKKVDNTPVAKPASHVSVAQKSNVTNSTQNTRSMTTRKLIEDALENADSHKQVHKASKSKKGRKLSKKLGISPRLASISLAIIAGVLLIGFFAVQNIPNLSMRVAATRAGFNASLPGYNPSGFSMKGPINYSTGQVTVSFKANSDERSYDFIQKSSNWNSDALLANYIIAEGKQYQTYRDKGRTLYIYDGSNATWVDNGIWYQIEGESKMTSDQLIRIASSI